VPDHPWLWHQLGTVREALGDAAGAAAAYGRSAALAGRARDYALDPAAMARPNARLGRLALAAGDPAAATAHFARALAAQAQDREALHGIAEALTAAGRAAAAAPYLERLVRLAGEQDSLCAWLGECQAIAGDVQGAYDFLWDVLLRHPEFAQARRSLARLLLDAQAPAAALETLAPALDGTLDNALAPPPVYRLLAEAFAALGRHEDAEQARRLEAASEQMGAGQRPAG
jgi:predicted Zn-dependent protease